MFNMVYIKFEVDYYYYYYYITWIDDWKINLTSYMRV